MVEFICLFEVAASLTSAALPDMFNLTQYRVDVDNRIFGDTTAREYPHVDHSE